MKINYRKIPFFHSPAVVTNLEGITLIGKEPLTKKTIHKALYKLKKLRGLGLHHRVIINNDVVFFFIAGITTGRALYSSSRKCHLSLNIEILQLQKSKKNNVFLKPSY